MSMDLKTDISDLKSTCVVLLVDDQEIIAEGIRQMLVDEEDIEFHYCADPMPTERVSARPVPKPGIGRLPDRLGACAQR